MKTRRTAGLAASAIAAALVLAACGGSGDDGGNGSGGGGGGEGDGASAGIVSVNTNEPQNPLIPTHTNENGGGKVVEQLWAGLVYYDAEGQVHNEVAESIETEDNQTFTITLEDGWTFSNGDPVTANSFVDAWNYGALASNAQNNSYFFEAIEGFSYEEDSELTGLEVQDDLTFTVTLKQPESDFPMRLGYSAYYPLPESAFEDMEAFGENPIGNGPYMMDGEGAWDHGNSISLVPNPEYTGEREPQNGGVEFVIYDNEDSMYNDLLSDNVDVIDNVPASAFATFEDELGERAVNKPAATIQTLNIPEYLDQYSGEAGHLRRQAISMAINRQEITEAIFNGSRTPAVDFTSPVIDGWTEDVPGNEVLEYNPDEAESLWQEAEEIEPWGDEPIYIATNTDSDHQAWVEAACNSIRSTLGVECQMDGYPTFQEFLDDRDSESIRGLYRGGWLGDYPTLNNFLAPIYGSNAGSNDMGYSSEEFDNLVSQANSAETTEEANDLLIEAQGVLFEDLPGLPLWYQNTTGGYSQLVENVDFSWNGNPILYPVTKSE